MTNAPIFIEAVVANPSTLAGVALRPLLTVISFDAVDGPTASRVRVAPTSVDASVLGSVTAVASVTDNAGNTNSLSFEVVVRDTIAPVIDLPADTNFTLEAGDVLNVSCVAHDSFDPAPACIVTPTLPLTAIDALNGTAINFTAYDASGNTAQVIRTLTVIDTEPPVFRLEQASATVAEQAGVPFQPPAMVAYDKGNSSVQIQCEPSWINTSVLGNTTVRCVARDAAGNTAEISFVTSVSVVVNVWLCGCVVSCLACWFSHTKSQNMTTCKLCKHTRKYT